MCTRKNRELRFAFFNSRSPYFCVHSSLILMELLPSRVLRMILLRIFRDFVIVRMCVCVFICVSSLALVWCLCVVVTVFTRHTDFNVSYYGFRSQVIWINIYTYMMVFGFTRILFKYNHTGKCCSNHTAETIQFLFGTNLDWSERHCRVHSKGNIITGSVEATSWIEKSPNDL